MSIYTLERVLWDLHAQPEVAGNFRRDAEAVLNAYPLTDDERAMMQSLDVRAMADRGVSQMLLFISWLALNGPAGGAEYMQRMNKISH